MFKLGARSLVHTCTTCARMHSTPCSSLPAGYEAQWRVTCLAPQMQSHARASNAPAAATPAAGQAGAAAYPGCTALAAVVAEGMLLVANAGVIGSWAI